jgi:hypothetical protein
MADEVLKELWRIKDENARRFNGDINALFAELRRQYPIRPIRAPRRRAVAPIPATGVAEAAGPYAVTPKPAGKRRQRAATKKETPTN